MRCKLVVQCFRLTVWVRVSVRVTVMVSFNIIVGSGGEGGQKSQNLVSAISRVG